MPDLSFAPQIIRFFFIILDGRLFFAAFLAGVSVIIVLGCAFIVFA
jgi:hypothetical protein